VSDPLREDYTYLTELPEELRDRRRAAARRRRWRHRLAVTCLLAVIAAIAALAVMTLGGGSGDGEQRAQRSASRAPGAPPANPAGRQPRPRPVPILAYHAIQPPVAGAAAPQLFVPQADFLRQMRWLAENGFQAVTLDQVEAAWYEGGELPAKPIVVSFDGGYRSQYVAAFPELQRLGWNGVLNLSAGGADLADGEVRKMLDAGWELASQAISQADLTAVDGSELAREVNGSRRILRRRFGVAVDNFSYPLGRYDETVIAAVREAGYVGAQSELPGLATAARPYILNRIVIELDDGLRGLTSKLRAAGAA
jgi:peptidoglycan/xylan/chitin deacetylase (PgdA/CDA1 family)